ncbi:hypothetical protein J8851_27540, partial [Klebsiella pneumoniae]
MNTNLLLTADDVHISMPAGAYLPVTCRFYSHIPHRRHAVRPVTERQRTGTSLFRLTQCCHRRPAVHRTYFMTETAPLYYDEGVNGSTKFTFEVYRDSAQYVVYVRRWNAKKNTILEETRYTSPDKAGLREIKYTNSRPAKAFFSPDYWRQ